MAEHEGHSTRNWLLGIAASVVVLAVGWVAQFVAFGLDSYVDKRAETVAKATFANGGVTPSEVKEVRELVSGVITRLDAADSDRQDIKEDLRNIVRILSRE